MRYLRLARLCPPSTIETGKQCSHAATSRHRCQKGRSTSATPARTLSYQTNPNPRFGCLAASPALAPNPLPCLRKPFLPNEPNLAGNPKKTEQILLGKGTQTHPISGPAP